MRYFFHIGYNGFNYHGWQRHTPHLTVQEVLELNISKLLKMPITISGCGRTDAQVHANQYFFHVDIDKELYPASCRNNLAFRLNKMLPHDIAVFDIIQVENNAHAQYDAVKRTYDYFVHRYKNPFLYHFSCLYVEKNMRMDAIQQAMILLLKHKDYRAFCKSPDKYTHTLCNITAASLFSDSKGDILRFQISSNRFLRGMMRAIILKLLKIGSGTMGMDEFENYLISTESNSQLEFAIPQGLYLSGVVYPFLNLPPRMDFSPLFQNANGNVWQAV